jgi:methylmalonyl-CoA mutase
MTGTPSELHVPVHPVRFVTAASLFDGHDAAINVMRRLLQAQGAEVVHLGHDRSVDTVVRAAVEEDVQGVAISSYQGGHVEYFSYLVERLAEAGAGHVQVFGGGGGVIVPEEIALLRERGVTIFAPEDGQRLGLPGMINELIRACDTDLAAEGPTSRRCAPATRLPWPGRSRCSRRVPPQSWPRGCARRPPGGPCLSLASPVRVGRASRR